MRDQGFGPDLHAGRQGTSWNSYRFALAYEGRFAPEAALADVGDCWFSRN
jgi:hypothetical protein